MVAAVRPEDFLEEPGNTNVEKTFRPDLEGLRAVAVGLVLLFHAGITRFSGGYIGVDVFYVLSGFLITGLITRELRANGRLSLTDFYARRARRLLPAALVVLAVTLLASALILPGIRIPTVSADVASAALYVSNIRFAILANDYFAADTARSPVIHFWSLGVEEQFYLFWPAILLGVYFWARRSHNAHGRLAVAIAVIGLASFVLSLWLTNVNLPWAFFSLPSRAWELAAGGVLAVLATRFSRVPALLAEGLSLAGLAMILAGSVIFTGETPFPGTAALVPVTGAVLLILCGTRRDPTLVGRLLSLSPFRFLGRISYSLYLWHWPMIVLGTAALGQTRNVAVGMALLAIPVAAVSERLIERPIRTGHLVGLRTRHNLIQAGIASAFVAVLCVGAARWATGSADNRLHGLVPPINEASAVESRVPFCTDHNQVLDPKSCTHGVEASDLTVVLFGNSHAAAWYPGLEQLAQQHGWRLVSLTRGACPAATVAVVTNATQAPDPDCVRWRDDAIARIAAEHPAMVIASSLVRNWIDIDGVQYRGGPEIAAEWKRGTELTLSRLTPITDKVVVIGDVPQHVDVPECLLQHPDNFDTCASALNSVPRAFHAAEHAATKAAGQTFIDPTPWLCDQTDCPAVIDNTIVYRDENHLTDAAAELLAPRLDAQLPVLPPFAVRPSAGSPSTSVTAASPLAASPSAASPSTGSRPASPPPASPPTASPPTASPPPDYPSTASPSGTSPSP